MNRKFGFVFDRDIADTRWFGGLISKDPSFVNKTGIFDKNRPNTLDPASKNWKCTEIYLLFHANVQHLNINKLCR